LRFADEAARSRQSLRESPHPVIFLLLNLPFGITTGYIIVAVPFLSTKAGLPVLTAASIVSMAITPKAWKVVWSPLTDMGLTLKTWYVIGAATAGGMLWLQSLVPLTRSTIAFVTATLFMAEFGSSLLSPSIGGLIADTVPEKLKGQAAGWYQLGGKVGRGFGGGVGLWLALRFATPVAAGFVLGMVCFLCMTGLVFLHESKRHLSTRAVQRMLDVGRELWHLIRSRDGAVVVALSLSPIGVSGVDNFWSGIAHEWGASARAVVLVTGFANAGVSSLGCLLAGWWADRKDRRYVYLATGALLACTSAVLAISPRVSGVFIGGTLVHRMTVGMCDVALTALGLNVIGRSKAAATKFAVFAGMGNVPEIYMTITSGWTHDHWNTAIMLIAEAVVGLVSIAIAAWLLRGSLTENTDTPQVATAD
jgi:MFS family permease